MKRFRIKITPEALDDIHGIAGWYDDQKAGLGKRFQNTVIRQIDFLAENPRVFAIRYKKIRCMLIPKFPYMVHFHINEEIETIEILAVISTDRDPLVWKEKTKRP